MLCLLIFALTDSSSTAIYTPSLHDALPIYHNKRTVSLSNSPACVGGGGLVGSLACAGAAAAGFGDAAAFLDRKSTRLNSSHGSISYAVFCLKKKISSKISSLGCSASTVACV